MPTSADILERLAAIAVAGRWLAVLWHLAAVAATAALAFGWRPTRSTAGLLLCGPLATVAVAAFVGGLAFNGVVFAALTAGLAAGALLLVGDVGRGPAWAVAGGVAMVLFGWFYPHFLTSPVEYAYAAPTGLVPCPTLSLVVGVALVADGLGSRPWSLALAAAGLFYGLLGALWLGVTIDLALVAGAAALAVLAFRRAQG